MLDFFKQKDKQKHILGLLILVFVLGAVLNSIALAFAVSLVIGLGKEVLDYVSTNDWFQRRFAFRGTFDHLDIVADLIGIIIGVIALLILGVPLL